MLRRLGRLLRSVTLGLLLLLLGGFLYQGAATAIDAHRFPPPGRLVDVGGRRMHIRCEGSGGPAVILEAGLGGSSLDWSLVAPALTKSNRVCVYDRAGLGWSDGAPAPRTADQVASDLHTVLAKAGERGPFVLVAHSIGGLYARLFAARYPQEVGAVVLVDPTDDEVLPPQARAELDPALVRQLDAKIGEARALMAKIAQVSAFGSRIGAPRLLAAIGAIPGSIEGQLPPAVRAQYRAVSSSTRFFATVYAESAGTEASIGQVKAATFPAQIPLTVLRPKATGTADGAGLPPEAMEALKRYAGTEPMLALSSRSNLVTVEETGHYIQLDQPQVVIAAVEQAVEVARGR